MSDIVVQVGDSLSLMPRIAAGSVDLIIADPPYNLGKNYGNNHDIRGFREHLQFSEAWSQEAHRVLAQHGTLYVFMGFRFISHLYDILDQRLGMYFNSWITWHYTQGVGRTRGFSPRHDDILMFTKSQDFVFNLDSVRVPQKYYRHRNNMDGANPGDVWSFSHVHYSSPEREDHPTQKPEALIARMILASSSEGDLVLDPFSGTGTTARVCQVLNRRCLAIEINPAYVALSRRRLSKHFEGFDSVDPRLDRTPRDLPRDGDSPPASSRQMLLLEEKSPFGSPTSTSTPTRNPRRVSRR
jgi:DNA modification methylase